MGKAEDVAVVEKMIALRKSNLKKLHSRLTNPVNVKNQAIYHSIMKEVELEKEQ